MIEAGGRGAHARAMAFETDRDRDTDLAAMGCLTLRFTRVQVRTSSGAVTARITAALARRGSVLGPNPRARVPACAAARPMASRGLARA